jgi:hypothetical protein
MPRDRNSADLEVLDRSESVNSEIRVCGDIPLADEVSLSTGT